MPSMDLAARTLEVEKILGYKFTDTLLIQEALQLAGFRPNSDGNKNLALVGDAVLRLVLVMDGYDRGQRREAISVKVDTSVDNTGLGKLGKDIGVDNLVYKNPSQRGDVSGKSRASTVEALLGAVFLDSGKSTDAVRGAMAELGLAWPAMPN